MAELQPTHELLDASQYLGSLLHVVYLCHHIHVAWKLQPETFSLTLLHSRPGTATSNIMHAGAQQLPTSLLVLYISGNISWQ